MSQVLGINSDDDDNATVYSTMRETWPHLLGTSFTDSLFVPYAL